MGRIKIKHPSPSPNIKLKLTAILAQRDVFATRLIPLRDGYVVLTSLEHETDTILNPDCLEDLAQENFTPVMPPELRAKRTVILFGIDPDAFSHTTEEITSEIYRVNDFTEPLIDSVYKFPKGNTLKITFQNTAPAQKSLEAGIKMFNTRVPPHQIQQEEYVELTNCLRCYAINTHTTSNCPKPRDHQVCSECGAQDHTWRDCNTIEKKCLNCGGDHRTLAFKCPSRKEAIQQKKEEEKARKTTTYSSALTSTHFPSQVSPSSILAQTTKIHALIAHALVHELGEPGTYESELNAGLKLNNLPEIKIPHTPNAHRILNPTPPSPHPSPADASPMSNPPSPNNNSDPSENKMEDDTEGSSATKHPHPSPTTRHTSHSHSRSRSRSPSRSPSHPRTPTHSPSPTPSMGTRQSRRQKTESSRIFRHSGHPKTLTLPPSAPSGRAGSQPASLPQTLLPQTKKPPKNQPRKT